MDLSQLYPDTVEVTITVAHFNENGYINHSISTDGNQIYLDVCYWINFLNFPLSNTRTYNIPINENFTQHILNVDLYYTDVSYDLCDYTLLNDSSTIEFTTPIIDGIISNEIPDKLIVYPNPNSGEFSISTSSINSYQKDIKFFNQFGQIVGEESINKINTSLNYSNLVPGVYYLVGEGMKPKKIVISNY